MMLFFNPSYSRATVRKKEVVCVESEEGGDEKDHGPSSLLASRAG
jgi:hypothetical protein